MSAGRSVVVSPGDTMVSIAHANGYRSWEGIYGHPANASLRERCPDPAILLPGATVFLPEKGTVTYACRTTRRHVFRVKRLMARLRFSVGDEERVFANAPYELRVDAQRFEGATDGDGIIDVLVRPDSKHGRLIVWPDGTEGDAWNWTINVGLLDPIDADSGLRHRLRNLGYLHEDSAEGVADALSRFQHDHKLDVTGVLDAPTLASLRDRSGT
jgi:hypothetical protein